MLKVPGPERAQPALEQFEKTKPISHKTSVSTFGRKTYSHEARGALRENKADLPGFGRKLPAGSPRDEAPDSKSKTTTLDGVQFEKTKPISRRMSVSACLI